MSNPNGFLQLPEECDECTETPTQLDRIETMLTRVLELLEPKQKRTMKPAALPAYPGNFEDLWSRYPKRAGTNSKKLAFQAYNARLKGLKNPFIVVETLGAGVDRYAKWCEATGKIGTEYVKQMATFINQMCYLNDFEIPLQVVKVPADDDAMLTFARDRGMREPHVGESWRDYRAYVERVVTS
jgi:hypothetical protein